MQMNLGMWILAGALLGWLAYSYLHFNEARGKVVSIIIGIAGGVLGGKLIAPIFAVVPVAGEFSIAALFFAAALATAFLAAGNLVHNRWGI